MNVRRLPIADHALLLGMTGYLHALAVPPPPYHESGNWRADVEAPPPIVDRTRPAAYRFGLMEWARPPWLPDGCSIASVNYFPPGGSGLGWHTDSTRPGWRIYIGRPLAGVPGEFLHERGRLLDAPGLATAFNVSGLPGESWHAVRCEGARLSVGVRVTDALTLRALGLLG